MTLQALIVQLINVPLRHHDVEVAVRDDKGILRVADITLDFSEDPPYIELTPDI